MVQRGGGSDDSIFGVRSDDEVGEEDEEDSNDDDDRVAVDEIVVDNHDDGGGGGDTGPPTNLFGDVALFGDDAGGVNEPAVAGQVEVSAGSTVASSVSRSAGGKRPSDESRGEEQNNGKQRHLHSLCVSPGSPHQMRVMMVKKVAGLLAI